MNRTWPSLLRGMPSMSWGLGRAFTGESLAHQVWRHARERPDALAFAAPEGTLTYAELREEVARRAALLLGARVQPGEHVAIMALPGASTVAWILAVQHVGASAIMIPTSLRGQGLAHAFERAAPLRVILCDDEAPIEEVGLRDRYLLLPFLCERAPAPALQPKRVSPSSHAFFVFTSGTTGLPKPCPITQLKTQAAGRACASFLYELKSDDALYAPLPLYHASALLLGLATTLHAGATFVTRPTFSASAYWDDIRRFDVSALLYVGELLRFVLATPPSPLDRAHRVRVAAGNGLREDVWRAFSARFGVPLIREFYAATESPGGLVNLEGEVGSVGKRPLALKKLLRLVKIDRVSGAHLRDRRGRLVECAPGEIGELLIGVVDLAGLSPLAYRGYLGDPEASEKKLLRDVFRRGDVYFRTGDLMRHDARGYFYFVDRLGDTFRFRAENVSTTEVERALAPALQDARGYCVIGVEIPGQEGRAGLLAVEGAIDPAAIFARAHAELAPYAIPRFLRRVEQLPKTDTQKIEKRKLIARGIAPQEHDELWIWQPSGYVPLTAARFAALRDGTLRI